MRFYAQEAVSGWEMMTAKTGVSLVNEAMGVLMRKMAGPFYGPGMTLLTARPNYRRLPEGPDGMVRLRADVKVVRYNILPCEATAAPEAMGDEE